MAQLGAYPFAKRAFEASIQFLSASKNRTISLGRYLIALPRFMKISAGTISFATFVAAAVATSIFLAPDLKDIERSTNLDQQFTALKAKDNSVN
ncbi:hypothetical protein [Pseudobacteriovorax antillogorgiicola]|uniref:Uncharacterized protein n=1 Tax=Pseudobacteriovorax antillogorgiicola TaxID=1513793 RepID=A0A1Y6BSC2_9BACT|nr:hypothetical protein [Pseudobacteriovorax antillogorgiicola]TCS53173.1 hypothetical protein EDD56_108224 [Pseudobacteriovorax antillogorgiicola]SMF24618.1 hypothetical protein SAMN06296036_10822 [Pseudobacteriovorax antillogorgiicola]